MSEPPTTAVDEARAAYLHGDIEADELERRVGLILKAEDERRPVGSHKCHRCGGLAVEFRDVAHGVVQRHCADCGEAR